MICGHISNIQDFSINDGDGLRTTVFFSGCPLRCPWCSNPETLYETGDLKSADEIFDRLQRSFLFFRSSNGGVTFSGGEPTLQADLLETLVDKCAVYGIHTAIESCGYFDFQRLRSVLEKLDLIFFDIKHMDPLQHLKATGRSNAPILENIKKTAPLSKEIVIRIPLIHPFNDSCDNILRTASFLRSCIPAPKIELLPYHFFGIEKYEKLGLEYPGKNFSSPPEERIEELKQLILGEGVALVHY